MNLESYWYRDKLHPLLLPLLPFSLIFGLVTGLRRWSYRLGLTKSQCLSIPVLVIGNITAGGTGKTPLVIWLANYLKEQGKNPGIALRGVGGKKNHHPILVTADSNPFEVGDEAVLLAKNTLCPVVACLDRPTAAKILEQASCDLVLCDDGLQHYRLARQLEIAVVDGHRRFGNGLLLPAGPLRESVARLKKVDFIVVNEPEEARHSNKEFQMRLKAQSFIATHDAGQIAKLADFAGRKAHAIAGLGNPQRFFDLLRSLNIEIIPHRFPDHHHYKINDLNFSDKLPILMTEKDAIKCKALPFDEEAKKRQWFLQVTTEVSPGLKEAILQRLS